MSSYSPARRRAYGPRCSSPPIFVCYELPQPESYSRSSSPTSSDNEDSGDDCDDYSESESHSNSDATTSSSADVVVVERMPDVPVDPKDIPCPPSGSEAEDDDDERLRAEKREGKKKEVTEDAEHPATVNEEAPKPKRRKKRSKRSREESAPEIRPILTIRQSQGWVWNQDLFVPPYIKERYIASTPPSSYPSRHTSSPNAKGNLVNNNFFSTSNEADYEVECVEIRVDEGEMDGIIPRS